MSAHRDPDMVADYAKNARMRGLKVIIAGAGLAAALPGRGGGPHRPAGDRRAAARRAPRWPAASTRMLAIAQMPPGVPVACVGRGRRARTRPCWPRGSSPSYVIERYTRPEMGAVWSEQRKLDTWLAVELAVVDALAEQGVVPERGRRAPSAAAPPSPSRR